MRLYGTSICGRSRQSVNSGNGCPLTSLSLPPGERGGSSNAYTASEHTNFHFDVPSPHLEETLRRFVSFFECPLFREVSVLSELEIVQSEHEKNRHNDVWRTNQVRKRHTLPPVYTVV